MDIKVKGKYEDKPLKVKDLRPLLKNMRIKSKSDHNDEENETRQNPQNYAEYKASTTSKKVAEKSILAAGFSVKRLKIKGKQSVQADAPEPGDIPSAEASSTTFSVKKQKEKKAAQTAAAARQHTMQQSAIQTHRLQRKRKRNYQIRRIKRQIRNQTIASSSIVLLAMVLFVFTLSMFFFLAEDGDGNIEAGQPALMVSVAKSQIGNDDGEKYWRWYGYTEPVDWCACFVSWCANEAGLIEDGLVPMFSEVNEGIRWFQEQGRWIDATEETDFKPKPGTIVFFDWEKDGAVDHVGIVEMCKHERVCTIEGNRQNCTFSYYYQSKHNVIVGYGVTAN
ncbi:MAG: CHAP domain-containing protein, partial [Firmicutes bacterium]|nr:CHAP domain-containing protein [Bacillota bacterium]